MSVAAGRGESGRWVDDALDDRGHHEIRLSRAPGADGPIELEPAERAEDGGDELVRKVAFDLEDGVDWDERLATQGFGDRVGKRKGVSRRGRRGSCV